MPDKIWGPRTYKNDWGFDLVFTQGDCETMLCHIDQGKGQGKLNIRQGKTSGKWYSEIVPAGNKSAEIEVRQEAPEKKESALTQEDQDNLPF